MAEKRFQSGREVMTEYVRNYDASSKQLAAHYNREGALLSGRKLAQNLVSDLAKLLARTAETTPIETPSNVP